MLPLFDWMNSDQTSLLLLAITHPASQLAGYIHQEQLTYYQIIHLSIAASNPEDDWQAFLAYLEDLSPPL